MTDKTIEIEAETLEEAREQVKSQIPEGLHLLSEQVISDGKPQTVKVLGNTLEAALANAQGKIPNNADVIDKKETAPEQRVIRVTVEAFDEQIAKSNAEWEALQQNKAMTVQNVKLVVVGQKGFLGIGKKPNQYEVELLEPQPAIVEVTYKTKAKISATIGEKKAEVVKLAVMAYQERDGSLKLKGEDAKGRSFELADVSQPALLFVPSETLPYLQRNQKLWNRVKNPEVATNKPSPRQEPQAGGLLAALLLGPMMDSLKAENLLPGDFQITVVDTYADATMKIKGLGLFG